MLIAQDDEESVPLMADDVIQNKAAGLIIWPVMGDRLKDGRTPLPDMIYQKLARH